MDPRIFPAWLIGTHFLNILFLTLLARSGLQILGSFPRLYRNDGCEPGTEILKFGQGEIPRDRLVTSLEQEVKMPAWLALPGGTQLGIGRHWHFASVILWILTGLVYVVLLLTTGDWRRLVPTSPGVFPQALHDLVSYLHLSLPPPQPGMPYNALQQLTYFAVVFLLAPLQIATGAAMSPAVIGRFPWYSRMFGGRQVARSLHFASLLAFGAFVVVHTLMVVVHGLGAELAKMALGSERADHGLAILVSGVALLLVVVINVLATRFGVSRPRATQRLLGLLVDPVQQLLNRISVSHQAYRTSDISPYHWVNGRPPEQATYTEDAGRDFREWRLEIRGLVKTPARLSLASLRELGQESHIVKHNCIQGWSGVAEWTGVPLSAVLDLVGPLPQARFLVVQGLDDKAQTDPEHGRGRYYEVIDLAVARGPQAQLAYEMNGQPLSVEHGAPLRLRLETQLGFKMVKWIESIELVSDYAQIGQGQGGWREDNQFYSRLAAI